LGEQRLQPTGGYRFNVVDQQIVEMVQRVVGPKVTDDEARALAEWYANLGRGLANFPEKDMKGIEPPLRSTPGPAQP
jgi:hypothetical protein